MLDKLFYKMDKKGKEKRMSDKEILIIFGVFIVATIFIVIAAYKVGDSVKEKEQQTKTITMIEMLELLQDNYSIDVTKNLNGIQTVLKIDCDKDVCLYTSDHLSKKEIFTYKDKWYTLSNINDLANSTIIETDNKELNELFDPKYYNYDLIKSLIEVSNKESEEEKVLNVSVSLERYLKEYNYMYNELNKTDKDVRIPITIKLGASKITSIKMDYKEVDSYFNKSTNEITYNLYIRSINNNDMSDIVTYFTSNTK